MKNIRWADRVKTEEVLQRVTKEISYIRTIKRDKTSRICHIWLRNCLLKHVTAGKVEGWLQVKGRRGRRRKQLLDDLKETKLYRKWK